MTPLIYVHSRSTTPRITPPYTLDSEWQHRVDEIRPNKSSRHVKPAMIQAVREAAMKVRKVVRKNNDGIEMMSSESERKSDHQDNQTLNKGHPKRNTWAQSPPPPSRLILSLPAPPPPGSYSRDIESAFPTRRTTAILSTAPKFAEVKAQIGLTPRRHDPTMNDPNGGDNTNSYVSNSDDLHSADAFFEPMDVKDPSISSSLSSSSSPSSHRAQLSSRLSPEDLRALRQEYHKQREMWAEAVRPHLPGRSILSKLTHKDPASFVPPPKYVLYPLVYPIDTLILLIWCVPLSVC